MDGLAWAWARTELKTNKTNTGNTAKNTFLNTRLTVTPPQK
jgi:hypothetical protein